MSKNQIPDMMNLAIVKMPIPPQKHSYKDNKISIPKMHLDNVCSFPQGNIV